MNKKTIVTLAVSAGLLVAVIVGATFLYNYLSERTPAEPPLIVEQGTQQPADTASPSPPEQQGNATETERPPQEEGIELHDRAPNFTVQDFDGNEVSLSDMLGRPVVLNFWASWCPPCREEMPDFNRVYEELGEEVQFMMVCLVDGGSETRESGAEYIEENGFTFPVFYDMEQEAMGKYQIRSIPTTFFINAEGYIEARATGMINEETLRLGITYITN